MPIEIRFAEVAADKQSVFRLRYEIYVEEMDRYRSISDNDNRVMIEDVDALSRFLIAEEDGQIVGAMRWTWVLSARPLPVTADFISAGEYSLTTKSAAPRQARSAPLAWASTIRERLLTPWKRLSITTASGCH